MNNGSVQLMPRALDLGSSCAFTVGEILLSYTEWTLTPLTDRPESVRTVMGFVLPSWQRGSVWNTNQKIALIESMWRGIPIGTYTYNQTEHQGRMDNLLIDGQQRLSAIEDYVSDMFRVFGYLYSEITPIDKRRFRTGIIFPAYITRSEDETYLREYYNLMNFGGVSHSDHERA